MIWIYPLFLLASLAELVVEVRISRRNSSALLAGGAVEIAPRTLPLMTALYVLMYVASLAEYWLFVRAFPAAWFVASIALYALAKALKFWAVKSLGSYWTMRVLIVPGSKAVTKGPYRLIRHPNYVSVLMEIAATCLAGAAWRTCLLILILFGIVLYDRIRSEEAALRGFTDYTNSMADKRRFLP